MTVIEDSSHSAPCAPEGGTGVNIALINPRSRVLLVCAVILALLIPTYPGQAQNVQTEISFTISVEPTMAHPVQ